MLSALNASAAEHSGVPTATASRVLTLSPSVFARLGEPPLRALSAAFYARVFADALDPSFRSRFSSSTEKEAVDNFGDFLVARLGGDPAVYMRRRKGYRLIGRHAAFGVGRGDAGRWLVHMRAALGEVREIVEDGEVREALYDWFAHTAYYIVAGQEFQNPSQLSGGLVIDGEKNW